MNMEERLWHRAERNSWIRMAHIAVAFFSLIASLERKKGRTNPELPYRTLRSRSGMGQPFSLVVHTLWMSVPINEAPLRLFATRCQVIEYS